MTIDSLTSVDNTVHITTNNGKAYLNSNNVDKFSSGDLYSKFYENPQGNIDIAVNLVAGFENITTIKDSSGNIFYKYKRPIISTIDNCTPYPSGIVNPNTFYNICNTTINFPPEWTSNQNYDYFFGMFSGYINFELFNPQFDLQGTMPLTIYLYKIDDGTQDFVEVYDYQIQIGLRYQQILIPVTFATTFRPNTFPKLQMFCVMSFTFIQTFTIGKQSITGLLSASINT